MLRAFTRAAYRTARTANKLRAIGNALRGDPTTLVKQARNKYLILKPLSRFLR
jgi:hypothetical protein